jgi:small subunit ribosomal protein S6
MVKNYEIGILIDPTVTKEEEEELIGYLKELIEKSKGTVENIDEWGRRKLAYKIKKHTEAVYYFLLIKLSPDSIAKIEKSIRLHERIIRFLVLSLDEQVKKANRLIKIFKRTASQKAARPQYQSFKTVKEEKTVREERSVKEEKKEEE